jgi:hypothetical protein
MKFFSKKIFIVLGCIVIIVVAGYFVWQKYKYKIIEYKVSAKVSEKTDGLYKVRYDDLKFDEITGNASMKNIRIIPDTNLVKTLTVDNMPDILLDVTIATLTIKGAKTAKALLGKEVVGDTVIIDDARITMYSVNPLQKGTRIESQANMVYKEILGKLNLIKVGFVFVNNVNVEGISFASKEKNFDFINGKFLLEDVLIDSSHHLDTNRILFCRQAAFTVDSFFSYNNGRKELSVRNVNFLGKERTVLFDEISLDRFPDESGKGTRLLDAKTLRLSGVNTNEVVKNKNIVVDTILCKTITAYELPVEKLKSKKEKKVAAGDTTGFRNVYSISMQHLNFPKVTFVPFAESNLSLGNLAIKVNGVAAERIVDLETHPADYSKEVEVALDRLSIKSKDGLYHFKMQDIALNSLKQQLNINSFSILPSLGEKQFAAKSEFQKDRYEVTMTGIALKNIQMNNLIAKKLVASDLVIDKTNAKIYRDIHKQLEQKNKVGNYPSQLLHALDLPVNVGKATFQNAYIEYRENETVSDSIGVISFANSKLTITNITNMADVIKKNNELNIQFDSKALGIIPLNGNFKFLYNNIDDGNFIVNGSVGGFNALELNKVSIPMALLKLNTGKINSLDFHFKGNNTGAEGDFTMKYEDLKVDILKRDKNTNEVRKRGLASLAANVIVKNNNPDSRGLRQVTPSYKRNTYKSFFNLVWKMIFTGMKETVGIP